MHEYKTLLNLRGIISYLPKIFLTELRFKKFEK